MMDSTPESSHSALDRLLHIVGRLRGDGGCPWDIKQTPASLKKYLLEECSELVEAIDTNKSEGVCEEIGDLFFILTLLTKIYTEQQQFTIEDVLDGIVAKMIRRHPHVFAGAPLSDEQELRDQWERIKQQEKSTDQARF